MEIGIVGLPNVGKSSLFNALTGAGIAAENFPFTTIEPNVGIVPLNDERLARLSEEFGSHKITPAGIRFVDIAGLVEGASQGEGLGNKFLSNIRNVDAICHVVRCFEDDDVVNVMSALNPVEAANIIDTELLLSDIQQAQNALDRVAKKAKANEGDAKKKAEGLTQALAAFNDGKPARSINLPQDVLDEYQFLTAKPVLYVANTDEGDPDEKFVGPLREKAKAEGAEIITLCTKIEAEILELPEEERAFYYEEAGITSPGLTTLAQAGRELLKLVCFFTAGEQETRAWLVEQGTKAPQAAGKIHTDIERGFIRAETYSFADLEKHGSHQALQEKGLLRLEGKEYPVQEGDVIYFRFNV